MICVYNNHYNGAEGFFIVLPVNVLCLSLNGFQIAPSIRKKGLLFQTEEISRTAFKSHAEVINKDVSKLQLY